MLLDLGALHSSDGQVPKPWARSIETTSQGFLLRGDPTSGNDLFLFVDDERAAAADSLDELLVHLASAGVKPRLNLAAISALLHHGVAPLPSCEYEQIHFLTVGDCAEISWGTGAPRVELTVDFPWLRHHSRGDSVASEAELLRRLSASTERAVSAAGERGFLMMSSGKDSTAVALALAELGYRHIPCVTFSSGANDPEPEVAAEVCKRLGLTHLAVEMPKDPGHVARLLTSFFESSSRPGVDLAQVPYVAAVMGAGSNGGAVLDGGGNDLYMGQPVKGGYSAKMTWRIRSRVLSELVQRLSPVDAKINYATKTRAEAALAGRNLRVHETRRFLPGVVDTRQTWRSLTAQTSHLDRFDLMAYMERHMGPGASQKKHILAAASIGHTPAVPWCDEGLASYYFHLPEQHKYDEKRGVNKVLLRSMLEKYLDYDASAVGKHYFTFDGARFLIENEDFVRTEIMSCALWDRAGLGMVVDWLSQLERRPFLYHAILNVFMISGWYNHSRYATSIRSQQMGVTDA